MKFLQTLLVAAFTFALAARSPGQTVPKGFTVPKTTLSPDGRYGVTVPVLAEHVDDGNIANDPKNSVIDTKDGRLLKAIDAQFTGWDRMGHGEILPTRWSPDGSMLLWAVDGKWSIDTLVLLKIEKGVVAWQTDVLKAAQQAILERTKQAAPQQYAAAKKRNEGNGAAYPEGFTIDASAAGPVALPMRVDVTLDSDPKGIDNKTALRSHLEGRIDQDRKFAVVNFHLGFGSNIRDEDGKFIVPKSGGKSASKTKR